MKQLFTLLSVLLSLNCYTQSKEVIEYHEEIANTGEYSNSKGLYFYKKDVKIFVDGDIKDYLKEELDSIIKELNDLIIPIEIYYVDSKEEANMKIFFGHMDEFMSIYNMEYEKEFLEGNWGAFWIYPRGTKIMGTRIIIDTERAKSPHQQKHLLREEVTQSLGLRNDSYKYSDSMFYAGWEAGVSPQQYTDLDKEIIKYHYNFIYN